MTATANPTRVFDPDWLAMAWWGQPLARTIRRIGLAPLLPSLPLPDVVADLPGASSGHVAAVSTGLVLDGLDDASGPRIVVGGPCIGDCAPFPTLEALVDSVQPLLLARALRCPAVIYLGDREEMMGAGGEGRWGRLSERFATWIERLAGVVGVADVHVVRTSLPAHERALDAGGHPARDCAPASLDLAFHLGAAPPREQDEAGRAVTRRVVEAHLPAVIARHLGLAAPPLVVVAENLQQAGAILLAASLARSEGQRVEFVGHLPVPSTSGSQRMYRAAAWDKLPASDLERAAGGRVPGMHPLSHAYFASWLDENLRAELARISGQ